MCLSSVNNVRLFDYSGNLISVCGQTIFQTKFWSLSFDGTFIIVDSVSAKPTLSDKTCQKFNLISRVALINGRW